MVLMTYIVVGCMGYIAFSGESFKAHFFAMSPNSAGLGQIEQNFLNMYRYDQVPAIFIRSLIYIQLSCSYPLVNHFQRTVLFNLFFGTTDVTDKQFKIVNIGISTVPLFFALFYPLIGNIIGIAASISGFFMIYVVPVLTYLKMRKIEIENPMLAAALQENEVTIEDRPTFKDFD